jgi:hypothetical protein
LPLRKARDENTLAQSVDRFRAEALAGRMYLSVDVYI